MEDKNEQINEQIIYADPIQMLKEAGDFLRKFAPKSNEPDFFMIGSKRFKSGELTAAEILSELKKQP